MIYFGKKTICLFVTLSILLIAPLSFAGLQEALSAIETNNIQDLQKELAKGFDPNTIEEFATLPTGEVSIYLLANTTKPLDATKFLNLIFSSSIRPIPGKSDSATLIKLVDLALANKAKLDEVRVVFTPMAAGLGSYLLDKGMPASNVLHASMNCVVDGQGLIDAQRTMVSEALSKGVDRDSFSQLYPWLSEVFNGEPWCGGLSQALLLLRLQQFSSQNPLLAQSIFSTTLSTICKDLGCCYGLTTCWGHTKLLEEKAGADFKYSSIWFKKMIKTTAGFTASHVLSKSELEGLGEFWRLAFTFQGSFVGMGSNEVLHHLGVSGRKLEETYTTFAIFDSVDQLANVLEKIVHEGEFVYVYCPMHVMGIYKTDKSYCFLDVNNNTGEHRYFSPKSLAQSVYYSHDRVVSSLSGKLGDHFASEAKKWRATGRFTLVFSVIADAGSKSPKKYLTEEEELKLREIRNIGDLYSVYMSATYHPRLLHYLLVGIQNKQINIKATTAREQEDIMSVILRLALKLDNAGIVRGILTENGSIDVNVPAQNLQAVDQMFAGLSNYSFFLAAVMMGAVKSVQEMFELHKVTDINQINKALNKTALDFALEGKGEKFEALVKFLEANGAKKASELVKSTVEEKSPPAGPADQLVSQGAAAVPVCATAGKSQ